MIDKKVIGTVKIYIPAQGATPAPPIGSALGSYGIKLMDFCKEFNSRTSQMESGSPVPTVVSVYQDKTFTFDIKTPPTSYLVNKYSQKNKDGNKTISKQDVNRIIAIKKVDLTSHTYNAHVNTICGTLKSMSIKIVEDGNE